MKNIVDNYVEKMANDIAKWTDDTIKENVPEWKLNFLMKLNHPLLRKFLRVDIEIISEDLIAEFGIQKIIKLNGKVIGRMKYKI